MTSTYPPPSPRSARSSTSSAPPPPLTPVYELSSTLDDMAIASSSGSSNNDEEESSRGFISSSSGSGKLIPIPSPTELPSSSFSFGSCPSVPINRTPTHELGPFDYPSASSSTALPTSPRRMSLALGMTHRRGSIVTRSNSTDSDATIPVAPATRRSSTCSTITTLPLAGRRPSILHSASTNSGPPPPPTYSPTHSRRSSLMFPQKPLNSPIPPSLLARRGSLPVSQLNNLDLSRAGRASFAGQGSYTTSTSALYRRRESVMSDGEGSFSSGHTVTRRASILPELSPELVNLQPRRSSFPHSTLNPPDSPEPPFMERKKRMSSVGSKLRGSSLSSSEEEEEGEEGESDEMEVLPTPSTAGVFSGFTNPWAVDGGKAIQGTFTEREAPVLGNPI